MRILSLDPSVNNVGWTKLNTKTGRWKWGTWKLGGSNYQVRLVDLIQKIAEDVGSFDILITEWPSFFSSEKGQIAAHQNYTIDLAGICGYVAGRFGMDQRTWKMLTPSQWKGSVPKRATAAKFFREFPDVKMQHISEHAIDSTMILLFWLRSSGRLAITNAGETLSESLLRFY